MTPAFADLRNITSAVDSEHDGFDPLVSNPRDPWQRPMNYPRLWISILSAAHIHQDNTVALGVCIVAAYFLSLFLLTGAMNAYEGGLFALLVCSPAAMLAVERGNNDLVVFIFLTMALLALRRTDVTRWIGYVLIGLCAVLKLYPACVYVLALREKLRASIAIIVLSGVGFVLYLFLIANQLKAISAALPRFFGASYGSRVLFDRLQAEHLLTHAHVFSIAAMFIVVAAAYVIRRKTPSPELCQTNSTSLMLGAVLFVATYFLGNNFNYRLIMLLFSVPALLELAKRPNNYGRFAGIVLAVMIVAFWVSPFWFFPLFLIKEAANWILFGCYCFLLFHLVPEQLVLCPRRWQLDKRIKDQ